MASITKTYTYTETSRPTFTQNGDAFTYSSSVLSSSDSSTIVGTITSVSFTLPLKTGSSSKNLTFSWYFKIQGADGITYQSSTQSATMPDNDGPYDYTASLSTLPPAAAFNGTFSLTFYGIMDSTKTVYIKNPDTFTLSVAYNPVTVYGYSSGWQSGTLKVYNGSSWVSPQVYNGSEWISL